MRAKLQARPRPPMSKGGIHRLRRDGYTPVSISHKGAETKHFSVQTRTLNEILRRGGAAPLIEIQAEGERRPMLVLPRQIGRDPVTHGLLQVGFLQVSARQHIAAPVAVTLVGQPEDVRAGTAVLEHEASTVEVRALPDKLPTHINVDVSGMEIGSVLHVSDIPANPDYEILTAPETVVAVVHTVRAAVTPQEEAEVTEEETGTQAGQAAKEEE